MAKANFNNKSKLRKIPILISKYDDNNIKGWRAEISDDWENYKPKDLDSINFEDLSHHFHHQIDVHQNDCFVFETRKKAVECAKYVDKEYLKNKSKIWYC